MSQNHKGNNEKSTNIIDSNNVDDTVSIEDKETDDNNKSGEKNKHYIKNIRLKKVLPFILTAIICLCLGFYGGRDVGRLLPATHKSYPKSQVLATVGDVKITGGDFAKRMEPLYYYFGLKKLSNEEVESYETNTINYMTNLEALYQAGKDDKISVTDEEVNNNYESTMSSIESTFNLTQDEFLKKFDLSEDYIKTSLKKEMIATQYLIDNSEVSEKEAKNYYNKNKEDFLEVSASHILISNYDENNEEVSDEQKAKNKELAESILKKALAGDNFSTLAMEYSDDSYTANDGGDLGFFGEDEMDEAFEKAAFSLKVGEIYPEVVETSYGYHIIKKTGEKYSDFDDVKDTLIETLSNDKQSNLLQDAIEKYNVEVNM